MVLLPPERRQRELLLLQLPAAIATAQLTLLWRTSGAGDFLVISLLVWLCACLIWLDRLDDQRQTLQWSRWAFFGLIPLIWVLMVLTRPHTLYDALLNAVPLATLLGLVLLLPACPWRGLLALGLLPPLHYALISWVPTDLLTRLTAQVTATLLWLGGVPVLVESNRLQLPSHQVLVGAGCAGLNALSLCIASVVALVVLNGPLSRWRLLLLLLAAPTVAFSVNALRVTLLALLPVQSQAGVVVQSPAFRFWHDGGGSTLFALVAVSLLIAFEHQLRRWHPWLLR